MTTTVRWLWLGLLLAALLLRLAGLNSVPLSPAESQLAFPALEAARGLGWPAASESPFLLTGNALLFWLGGPGDGIARLLPALAGTALVAVPWLWRRRIGEAGALAAAVLLAGSPLLLFASRRLDGAVVGVLGSALVLSAWCFREAEEPARPGLAAVGLALGLTAGPAGYDLFLAGLLAGLVYRWFTAGALPVPGPKAALTAGWIGLGGLGGALLITTALGWRWNGWGSLGDGLAVWLRQWQTGGASYYPLPFLLAFYEPLTLLLALVALGWAGWRRAAALPQTLRLGLWALLALLWPTLRPGAEGVLTLSTVFPLALLGGQTVQRLLEQKGRWRWTAEGLQGVLTALLWGYLGLLAAHHAAYGVGDWLEVGLVVLVSVIQVLLALGFAAFFDSGAALRGALAGTVLVVGLVQLAFGLGLIYQRTADPAEPLITQATTADMHALRRWVAEWERLPGYASGEREIVLVAGEAATTAVVRWTLRDWPQLRVMASWPTTPAALVLTPPGVATPLAAEGWRGMAFTATVQVGSALPGCTSFWPPACRVPLAWYLYRRYPVPLQRETIVVWLPVAPAF